MLSTIFCCYPARHGISNKKLKTIKMSDAAISLRVATNNVSYIYIYHYCSERLRLLETFGLSRSLVGDATDVEWESVMCREREKRLGTIDDTCRARARSCRVSLPVAYAVFELRHPRADAGIVMSVSWCACPSVSIVVV